MTRLEAHRDATIATLGECLALTESLNGGLGGYETQRALFARELHKVTYGELIIAVPATT